MDPMTLAMIAGLLLMFYFMMIRPENKKKKQLAELRNSITAGDEVTTIGGMIGKVVHTNETSVTFETGEDRVRIKVARWAISNKEGADTPKAGAGKTDKNDAKAETAALEQEAEAEK